jgi:hypothetical protein
VDNTNTEFVTVKETILCPIHLITPDKKSNRCTCKTIFTRKRRSDIESNEKV